MEVPIGVVTSVLSFFLITLSGIVAWVINRMHAIQKEMNLRVDGVTEKVDILKAEFYEEITDVKASIADIRNVQIQQFGELKVMMLSVENKVMSENQITRHLLREEIHTMLLKLQNDFVTKDEHKEIHNRNNHAE